MYSDLPPRWKWANRICLSMAWAFGVLAGIFGLTDAPQTITQLQPGWMSVGWVLLVIIGSAAGLVGVVTGRNRVEEAGAWFAGSGSVAYVLTLWTIVWSGEYTRSTQASMMTALLFFMLGRALSCGAHAYKIRKASTQAINTV